MRKNELDKINDKMGLIEETLKDEVPKISMPVFSYEAKEERHAKEKRTLMKIIVFLVAVILAIVCGFLVFIMALVIFVFHVPRNCRPCFFTRFC